MKRYLRFVLVLMLSLALPLSGMAGVQSPIEPCPMQNMGMATMDDMGMDCCQDSKNLSDHGKTCKPGQECKTASVLQVLLLKPAITPSTAVVLSLSGDFLPVQAPSGVWRPPRV